VSGRDGGLLPESDDAAAAAVDRVFRTERTVVLATLIRQVGGDFQLAEDALQDALAAALTTWRRDGVPDRPGAWITVAARRRAVDRLRRDRSLADRAARLAELTRLDGQEQPPVTYDPVGTVDDDRLRLIFTCCHPALDPSARVALTLRTVGGLTTREIARAFLVAEPTMAQRLVRAKAKIRDAGIPFEVPCPADLPARLGPVLDAVYAAFGTGWEDADGVDPRRRGLASEATWLARILVQLAPGEAEARGLLALLLHCEARREARRSTSGAYVPLDEQDTALWSRPMIAEAERALASAAALRSIGRYQLEAAIQSVHAQRAITGRTDWGAVALLYDELVRLSPTLGALVGRAAALSEARDPAAGLAALDAIDARPVVTYQPYWAVRAHLLARLGDSDAARDAFAHAIGLSEDQAVREFLIRGRDRLSAEAR